MTEIAIRFAQAGTEYAFEAEFGPGVTGIIGPSGAGKSSLLAGVAGLRTPSSGRIVHRGDVWFDDRAGTNVPPHRRSVGFAFQDDRIFDHMSVADNLEFGAARRAADGSSGIDRRTVDDALGLRPLLGRSTATLSGGERKRIGIARAILSQPRLLLLDEPLAGLDAGLRAGVIDLVGELSRVQSIPVVWVGHSMWEIEAVADGLLIVDDGRIAAKGTVDEVFSDARSLALASRLGLDNLLEVEIVRHDEPAQTTVARLAGHELTLPPCDAQPGERGRVSIRPGDVLLAAQSPSGLSARNAIEGRIAEVVEAEGRFVVGVDIGATVRAEVTRASVEGLDLRPGGPVSVILKTFAFTWRA